MRYDQWQLPNPLAPRPLRHHASRFGVTRRICRNLEAESAAGQLGRKGQTWSLRHEASGDHRMPQMASQSHAQAMQNVADRPYKAVDGNMDLFGLNLLWRVRKKLVWRRTSRRTESAGLFQADAKKETEYFRS